MPHPQHAGNEREERQRRALTGCLLAIGLVSVAGLATFAYIVVADVMDGPRNMDASQLDALIGGTTIIEEPHVGCPQGREPIGDCEAVAWVGPRTTRPAVDVIAENAEGEGFTLTATGDFFVLRATSGDRCLSVVEANGPMAVSHPGSVEVYLSWC